MKKNLICLANSKKYTERCIAGIELANSSRLGYRYEIVKRRDNPVWIRPVSDSEHGEIASQLVDHINLLDVVEIKFPTAHPQGYQSENVLFDDLYLKVVDNVDKCCSLLDKLLAVDEPTLFGNKGRAVRAEDVAQLNRSLVFIKPADAQVYETTSSAGNPQIRASFVYNDVSYDLPVTDIDFSERFGQDPQILQPCTQVYFTVSLGIEFEGWHYKLVAGIVCF